MLMISIGKAYFTPSDAELYASLKALEEGAAKEFQVHMRAEKILGQYASQSDYTRNKELLSQFTRAADGELSLNKDGKLKLATYEADIKNGNAAAKYGCLIY